MLANDTSLLIRNGVIDMSFNPGELVTPHLSIGAYNGSSINVAEVEMFGYGAYAYFTLCKH